MPRVEQAASLPWGHGTMMSIEHALSDFVRVGQKFERDVHCLLPSRQDDRSIQYCAFRFYMKEKIIVVLYFTTLYATSNSLKLVL